VGYNAALPRKHVNRSVSESRKFAAEACGLRALLIYPLIAVAYAVTGWLGLLLATPLAYVTAIFPPAGVAVAAVMIAGRASLPWIYLGSFVLGVWVGHIAGFGSPATIAVAAAAIAAGATIQAALAGWALRRTVGYPAAFDRERDLLRFVLLSLSSCVTSASVATGTLWALGVATTVDLVPTWLIWWGGDTLAVLIVVPLVLVLVGEPRALWRRRLAPMGLPLLAYYGLLAAMFYFAPSWLLLGAGLLGAALLTSVLLLGTGYSHRVAAEVEERTRGLVVANERLQREIGQQRDLEAAHHAERIDAMVNLTGGIAHDFNNLLTVVSTNAELLQRATRSPTMQRRAAAIQRSAEHAARLTRQMLAFSRRQSLRPEPVDLRQRITAIAELASRVLQEDVEIAVKIPEELWPIWIDPVVFERAVSNIAANARDAMPNGGRFSIEAENASFTTGDRAGNGLIGDFVALTLTDTGGGMSRDMALRAFEPYFMTKDLGAASGLGLSEVHGFVKQSGGNASITSEVGRGTSVVLFLPRAKAAAVTEAAPVSPSA
jgi:signal transduction histidine kinase